MTETAKKMEMCRLFCRPAIAGRDATLPTFGVYFSLPQPFRKWPTPVVFSRRNTSSRGKMPLPAQGTKVGFALPLDPQEAGGVQGVALAAIPPFPAAAMHSLVRRGFLHGFCFLSQTSPDPRPGKRPQTQGPAPASPTRRSRQSARSGCRSQTEGQIRCL